MPPSHDLGAHERFLNVKLVQAGAACYLIMCQAVDSDAGPRTVQPFNRNEVFTSGDIALFKGRWLELKGRVHLRKVCV